MRKSKLNYFAAIGMVVAIGTAAFTAPKEKTVFNPDVETWFYQSNSMLEDDVNNPANYSSEPTELNCGNGVIICSIKDIESSPDSNQPALSHGDVLSSPQYQVTKRDEF